MGIGKKFKLRCYFAGDGDSLNCNRVALVHVNFIGLKDDASDSVEFNLCDKHFEFGFWFYEMPTNSTWRKGILITPLWEDEDEYKKALVEEMLEGKWARWNQ